MNAIDPYRMLGRIDYAISFLMGKYNLVLGEEQQPSWKNLLFALSTKVNDYDKLFCVRMAFASEKYLKETEETTLNQLEADLQKNQGMKEAEFIFQNYADNYADKVLEEKDFIPEIEEGERRKRREARRNAFLVISIVAVIVAGFVIYNLPYFAEQRAYEKVEDAFNQGLYASMDIAVEDYIARYPDGKHISDVMYMPVRVAKEEGDVITILDAVDEYLQADPKGKYAKECREISNGIWQKEISKYEEKAASSASEKGAKFVVDMLRYMRDNNVRTIQVVGIPHLDLKEYSEYDPIVREVLEKDNAEQRSQSASMPKLPDDVLTIKDQITPNDAADWTSYIVKAMQDGFNDILTPGFITFKESNNPEIKSDKKYPLVVVDYTVKTQDTVINIPTLGQKAVPDYWYQKNSSIYLSSGKILMGIQMTFDAEFSLPGKNITYKISSIGDPGKDQISVQFTSLAYSVMCDRCTEQFANKISKEFGLGKDD